MTSLLTTGAHLHYDWNLTCKCNKINISVLKMVKTFKIGYVQIICSMIIAVMLWFIATARLSCFLSMLSASEELGDTMVNGHVNSFLSDPVECELQNNLHHRIMRGLWQTEVWCIANIVWCHAAAAKMFVLSMWHVNYMLRLILFIHHWRHCSCNFCEFNVTFLSIIEKSLCIQCL